MHPLRRKPSKLLSKLVIVSIWALSLTFALPMGLVHTFGYVPDQVKLREAEDRGVADPDETDPEMQKPFCYIDFGSNVTNATLVAFKSYT